MIHFWVNFIGVNLNLFSDAFFKELQQCLVESKIIRRLLHIECSSIFRLLALRLLGFMFFNRKFIVHLQK